MKCYFVLKACPTGDLGKSEYMCVCVYIYIYIRLNK